MANPCHVRSISLPSRSHPSTLKIQEELNKLKALGVSSSTTLGAICNGLSGLDNLYKCLDELLSLPSTQQALFHLRNEKWFNELLDGPVRLLDICSSVRDVLSQFEENVRNLQSALRRKRDSRRESSISNYICSRKKMNKDVKKLLAAIKKMDTRAKASPLLDQDHQFSTAITVLRDVNTISIITFQSLLLFLSTPVLKSKPRRWSLVSMFMHKGLVSSCEEKQENVEELENIDFALSSISSKRANLEKMQIAQKGLGPLEVSIEGLENGLECMFKHLIKTRASLLNIISH